eukprot:NODE_285_length_10753_cov_0.438615.p1 type:complete len:1012 gc:universal NODE_285_length_10753_cov_0.438615:4751-1716(-)
MFFTITLNLSLTSILAFIFLSTILVYYFIRYTWLNQYERQPQMIPEKANFQIEGLLQEEPDKSLVYPDELLGTFLSSIKLFGYLEQPIFNELSKRLSTIRLVKGDYLFHETSSYNTHNFYMVVSGSINVYINCPQSVRGDKPGQLLLHKVTSGSTVSSFFTLLSLLVQSGEKEKSNLHQGLDSLTAQASEDTTLIVIPSDAFSNLSEKFPKAAAQISLVILTRFQRVTNLTLVKYFGYEDELHNIGISLNKCISQRLPGHIFDDGKLELLRSVKDKHVNVENYFYSEPNTPITPYMGVTFLSETSRTSRDDLADALNFGKDDFKSRLQIMKDDLMEELNSRLGIRKDEPNFLDNKRIETPTSGGSSVANFESDGNLMEILRFERDEIIVESGQTMMGLYFVLDGILSATYSTDTEDDDDDNCRSITYRDGSIVGYLENFTGFKSLATIYAETDVYLGFVKKDDIERMIDRFPSSVLSISKRILKCLPSVIFQIDFALEWVQVEAGHIIYKEGDEADAIYVVLNGRVRTYKKRQDQVEIISEYGARDRVGEIDVLTNSKRRYCMHAIRDSDLAKLPKSLFKSISTINPQMSLKMSRLIASRLSDMYRTKFPRIGSKDYISFKNQNLKTVAVLPINNSVPLDVFATRLKESFDFLDLKSVMLTKAKVLSLLGKHAFTKYGALKLSNWLSSLEEDYDIVLFIGDGTMHSQWNYRCITQADCCLLVAAANDHSSLTDFERYFLSIKTTARKELVLIHNTKFVDSMTTSFWLKHRPWIHAHHHLEMASFTDHTKKEDQSDNPFHAIKDQLQRVYTRYILNELKSGGSPSSFHQTHDQQDFRRLARRLSGKSIGVVLGGGGARGISHLGVLQALEEANVPIDCIGGTSIGAFIGGLYSRNGVFLPAYGKAKSFSGRMSSIWRKLFDLTYPITSYFTGHEFNRGLWKEYGNVQMEDFWINFFCVTTNITHSKLEIHQRGYAWRYVRASMSLSGFVPPISDNGNLLLDGGYVFHINSGE